MTLIAYNQDKPKQTNKPKLRHQNSSATRENFKQKENKYCAMPHLTQQIHQSILKNPQAAILKLNEKQALFN